MWMCSFEFWSQKCSIYYFRGCCGCVKTLYISNIMPLWQGNSQWECSVTGLTGFQKPFFFLPSRLVPVSPALYVARSLLEEKRGAVCSLAFVELGGRWLPCIFLTLALLCLVYSTCDVTFRWRVDRKVKYTTFWWSFQIYCITQYLWHQRQETVNRKSSNERVYMPFNRIFEYV